MPPKLKETKARVGRRGNNEGSIFKRKDGRWSGSVTIGYKTDGRPMRKTFYGKTRQEVARKVTAVSEEVFQNGYSTVSASKEHNFQILMKEWFDLFVAPSIASKTEESRRYTLKNHIFKAFGKLDIQDVGVKRLQRFFNEKAKAGLASDSIGKMKNLLNNFLEYALKQHYINYNPMAEVVIKCNDIDHSKEKDKALRPEIRQDVFQWVMDNPTFKPIVLTFSFTGLRPQELIALKWSNIDLDKKILSVSQAVNRVVDFDEEGNVVSRKEVLGKTKTPKSVRAFLIPEIVADALREWGIYCKENNIVSEFVFPNTRTGAMRTYAGLRSMLQRFIKKHQLEDEKITLYTFRHTFATMLLEQRESPKIVAQLMGHTKVSTTLDIYSHVVSSTVYEKTAQTLDGVYKEIAGQAKN